MTGEMEKLSRDDFLKKWLVLWHLKKERCGELKSVLDWAREPKIRLKVRSDQLKAMKGCAERPGFQGGGMRRGGSQGLGWKGLHPQSSAAFPDMEWLSSGVEPGVERGRRARRGAAEEGRQVLGCSGAAALTQQGAGPASWTN